MDSEPSTRRIRTEVARHCFELVGHGSKKTDNLPLEIHTKCSIFRITVGQWTANCTVSPILNFRKSETSLNK